MTSLLIGLVVSLQGVTKGPVTSLAFGSEGVLYAAGEGGVSVVSPAGAVTKHFKTTFPKAMSLAVSSDGQRILVAGGDPDTVGGLQLFDAESGVSKSSAMPHTDVAMAVALSTDGRWAASGGADGIVKVYSLDAPGLKEELQLEGHSGPVLSVAFLPGGSLVSAGRDGSLRVWDVATKRLKESLSFHTGPVTGIGLPWLVEGPMWCVTASEDRTVRVWQPEIGRMVRIIKGFDAAVTCVAETRNRLLCGSTDGTARLVSADGGTPLQTWSVPGQWVTSVAVSPDGKRGAIGASDGSVRLVDLPRQG